MPDVQDKIEPYPTVARRSIVNDKRWRFYKASAILYSKITADADFESTNVFCYSWIIKALQFNRSKHKVFISCADTSSKADVGLIIKYGPILGCNHRYISEEYRCQPES
jgi:hypothetical protein